MQSGKNAMESVKESAANVAASAKSGMEKTKATVQEKVEKMSTRDPIQKEMATHKKDERIAHAELEKQAAREQNVAAREAAKANTTGHTGYGTGATGTTTGHTGYGTAGTGTTTGHTGYSTGATGTTTGMTDTASYSTTGATGAPTGTHQMSALPGHGTGQPAGQVIEGVAGAHPIGTGTGTDRPSAAHNTRAGGTTGAQGYGTGGYYS